MTYSVVPRHKFWCLTTLFSGLNCTFRFFNCYVSSRMEFEKSGEAFGLLSNALTPFITNLWRMVSEKISLIPSMTKLSVITGNLLTNIRERLRRDFSPHSREDRGDTEPARWCSSKLLFSPSLGTNVLLDFKHNNYPGSIQSNHDESLYRHLHCHYGHVFTTQLYWITSSPEPDNSE